MSWNIHSRSCKNSFFRARFQYEAQQSRFLTISDKNSHVIHSYGSFWKIKLHWNFIELISKHFGKYHFIDFRSGTLDKIILLISFVWAEKSIPEAVKTAVSKPDFQMKLNNQDSWPLVIKILMSSTQMGHFGKSRFIGLVHRFFWTIKLYF